MVARTVVGGEQCSMMASYGLPVQSVPSAINIGPLVAIYDRNYIFPFAFTLILWIVAWAIYLFRDRF